MLSDCNDMEAHIVVRSDLEVKANAVLDTYHGLTQVLPEPDLGIN